MNTCCSNVFSLVAGLHTGRRHSASLTIRSRGCLSALCSLAFFLCSNVQAQSDPSVGAIAKAWQDRQDRIRSFRFSSTHRETVAKGAKSRLWALFGDKRALEQMGISLDQIVPPTDTTFEFSASLLVDGNKIKFSHDRSQWSSKAKTFVPQPEVSVVDGNVGKHLFSEGSPYTAVPSATVHGTSRIEPTRTLTPFFMTFRPMILGPFKISEFSLTGRRDVIDGKRCLELQRNKGDSIRRLWVDPSRGFLIIRSVNTRNERVRSRGNYEYRQHASGEWVPSQWDLVTFGNDGSFQESVRASVNSYSLNESIEPAQFELEFPKGTHVVSEAKGGGRELYIVGPAGSKLSVRRQTSDDEMGRDGRTSWKVPLAIVCAIVSGTALFWNRVRLRRLFGRVAQ